MSEKVRVAIAGASGRMGREAVQAVMADENLELVAVLVRHEGQAYEEMGIRSFREPEPLLSEIRPDVWLDLTDADSVVRHVDLCLDHGVYPVVGATGYSQADLSRWNAVCDEKGIGGIAAPNFAIGALLMMRLAKEAARLMHSVEIIELHHDGKKDAPSGTAKRTALELSEVVGKDVPVHSVRLPGLVAHQEVLFGGTGETLTIRHDSLSRASFMPGVCLACKQVTKLRGMVYGLENLLW